MRKKYFGAILTPGYGRDMSRVRKVTNDAAAAMSIYGADIATRNFISNLARHSDFDGYHFFVPPEFKNIPAPECFDVLGLPIDPKKAKLLSFSEFQHVVSDSAYHVLHRADGMNINNWLYLRNHLASRNVPITCVTHAISYQSILEELTLLLLNKPRPYDSIICTANSARTVVRKLLSHVCSGLKSDSGCRINYGGRLDVIPLGVDTEVFAPRDKAAIRHQLGLPRDKLIFLSLGRFSHYDKVDLRPLLMAFKAAIDHCKLDDALLLLAGDDSRHGYANTVRAWAAELDIAARVIIRPNPSMITTPLYYSASDVFLFLSDCVQETFGQTAVEALSSGLPVICSDWDGVSSTVQHDKTGLHVPTYWGQIDDALSVLAPIGGWRRDHLILSQSVCIDVPRLVGAMAKMRHVQYRMTLAHAARVRAVKRFDWRNVIAQYLALWDELNRSASTQPGATTKASWMAAPYCNAFSHYATKSVRKSTEVRTNKSQRKTLSVANVAAGYPEMSTYLRSSVLEAILTEANRVTTVGHLQTALRKAMHVTETDSLYHVLWLLKYNFLRLISH